MSRLGTGSLALGALLLATATSAAQGRHVFAIDQAQSAFTFAGTVQLPPAPAAPIVATPSNAFNLAGTLDLDLTLGAGGAVSSARFVKGGAASTVPDLKGVLPNPIAPLLLPPLATVSVTGLQVAFFSVDALGVPASFAVGAGGAFSTSVVAEILAGTVTFAVPAFGINGTLQLAGEQSPPQPISGTLAKTASGFQLNVPLAATFVFVEPTTGANGSVSLMGGLVAAYLPLNSAITSIKVSTGGVQTLLLSTGGALGGNPYIVLGTASGTTPGFPLGGGVVLPLNFDAFFSLTLTGANAPPFGNTFALLDSLGKAKATITVPTGLKPAFVGLNLAFAYVVVDLFGTGGVGFVSNTRPLTLAP